MHRILPNSYHLIATFNATFIKTEGDVTDGLSELLSQEVDNGFLSDYSFIFNDGIDGLNIALAIHPDSFNDVYCNELAHSTLLCAKDSDLITSLKFIGWHQEKASNEPNESDLTSPPANTNESAYVCICCHTSDKLYTCKKNSVLINDTTDLEDEQFIRCLNCEFQRNKEDFYRENCEFPDCIVTNKHGNNIFIYGQVDMNNLVDNKCEVYLNADFQAWLSSQSLLPQFDNIDSVLDSVTHMAEDDSSWHLTKGYKMSKLNLSTKKIQDFIVNVNFNKKMSI